MPGIWRTALCVSVLGWAALVPAQVAFLHAAPPRQTATTSSPSVSPQRALVDKYCVGCHNQRAKVGGLMLDTADVANISIEPAVWEKVVLKLRSRSMPPVGMPRPEAAEYDRFA